MNTPFSHLIFTLKYTTKQENINQKGGWTAPPHS